MDHVQSFATFEILPRLERATLFDLFLRKLQKGTRNPHPPHVIPPSGLGIQISRHDIDREAARKSREPGLPRSRN